MSMAMPMAMPMAMTMARSMAMPMAKSMAMSRDEWRKAYHNYKFASDAEAMKKPIYWDSTSNTWEYK
jgi:hypothetical protein